MGKRRRELPEGWLSGVYQPLPGYALEGGCLNSYVDLAADVPRPLGGVARERGRPRMRDPGGRLGCRWMRSAGMDQMGSERGGGCGGGQIGVAQVAKGA